MPNPHCSDLTDGPISEAQVTRLSVRLLLAASVDFPGAQVLDLGIFFCRVNPAMNFCSVLRCRMLHADLNE